ncbi:MAG: AAA family ATPase [Gammaproteobacteria bacterium]|nr:AAA family ATPase [Gammaproteobacteria bacterium]
MTVHELWVENYRCFRERQTARLAPLTLLVGENSTGKTSFLAMVRALHDIDQGRRPDFKKAPYDLGSFDEVAHFRGGRGGRAPSFRAGHVAKERRGRRASQDYRLETTFAPRGSAPALEELSLITDRAWLTERPASGRLDFGGNGKAWRCDYRGRSSGNEVRDSDEYVWPRFYSFMRLQGDAVPQGHNDLVPDKLTKELQHLVMARLPIGEDARVYASAPVRSRPRRTYDPAPVNEDAEGSYVPMLLADVFFRRTKNWESLKRALESFGQQAGLFDEIRVRALGKRETEPFQLQVRKHAASGTKGPFRNLIDVGYGVSQALPLLTEIFRAMPNGPSPARTFLLQQPEVHLHPSAQAALGSLFCELAASGRQLLVETHSDHLMDRIRMDVRDEKTKLKPEDVSILYFERGNLDVRIHSLRIDGEGNILGAPPGYRQFFMEETNRYLKL